MIKILWTVVLITTIWLEPATALDLSIQPRFKSGIQYYEFEGDSVQLPARDLQGRFPDIQGEIKFNDWLPYVSGGATVFVDRLFVDFDVQYSFDGEDDFDFNNQQFLQGGNQFPNDSVFQSNNNLDADFERLDWAISVGFEVYDKLVLFAGYKRSKSDLSATIQGRSQLNDLTPITLVSNAYTGDVDITLEYDGPFVGASYSWIVQKGFLDGALAFNFAAAFLDGKVDVNFGNIVTNNAAGQVPFDVAAFIQQQGGSTKGDSIGFSFGATWRGLTPVEGLTYSMGASGYRYEFENNNSADFNETQARVDFGLAYAFDF